MSNLMYEDIIIIDVSLHFMIIYNLYHMIIIIVYIYINDDIDVSLQFIDYRCIIDVL